MANFPQVTKAQRHGLLGLPLFETFVIDVAKCTMRETPQKVDIGIDGYVDIVGDDESATGRCIAFQIKCGSSFLAQKDGNAYVYYGENRHLNLFMNHPVPVIIVLIDPVSRKMWWVKFDINKTEGTETGWKISIPFSNQCSEKTLATWKLIAGPHRDYTQLATEEWQVRKNIRDTELVLFQIPRSHIEAMRFDFITETFDRLTSSRSMIIAKRNAVEFGISGYDNDPRELWQIPEVCQWWQLAESVGKYWFYFCRTETPVGGLRCLRACVTSAVFRNFDAKMRRYQVDIDPKKMNEFLVRNFTWLNEFTEENDISASVNYQISLSVVESFKMDLAPKKKQK